MSAPDYSDIELLRESFKPAKVRVLFVGESAPAGKKAFFYLETGTVYHQFRAVLEPSVGQNPNFLEAFKRAGFYLDDLVLKPVNWLSDKERKRAHEESVPSLAKRLADFDPSYLIAFMKGIELPVLQAVQLAGISSEVFTVPFPGQGQQKKFREQLGAIMERI